MSCGIRSPLRSGRTRGLHWKTTSTDRQRQEGKLLYPDDTSKSSSAKQDLKKTGNWKCRQVSSYGMSTGLTKQRSWGWGRALGVQIVQNSRRRLKQSSSFSWPLLQTWRASLMCVPETTQIVCNIIISHLWHINHEIFKESTTTQSAAADVGSRQWNSQTLAQH